MATLHDAARTGDLSKLHQLIGMGTDINQRDKLSRTALHLAAWSGQVDVVKLLVAQGCDIKASAMDDMNAMHFAAQKSHTECVKQLLSAGVPVDSRNRKGMTCLHIAAQTGNIELATLLLKRKANPLARNKRNETPVDLASSEDLQKLLEQAVSGAAETAAVKQKRELEGDDETAGSTAKRQRNIRGQGPPKPQHTHTAPDINAEAAVPVLPTGETAGHSHGVSHNNISHAYASAAGPALLPDSKVHGSQQPGKHDTHGTAARHILASGVVPGAQDAVDQEGTYATAAGPALPLNHEAPQPNTEDQDDSYETAADPALPPVRQLGAHADDNADTYAAAAGPALPPGMSLSNQDDTQGLGHDAVQQHEEPKGLAGLGRNEQSKPQVKVGQKRVMLSHLGDEEDEY